MTRDNSERGILSEADVEYLKGNKQYADPSGSSRARRRIRERVIAALHDFSVLLEHWSKAEQQRTLETIEQECDKAVEDLGGDAVATLYSLMNSNNAAPEIIKREEPVDDLLRFRKATADGIRRGKAQFGDAPSKVSIAATAELYELPAPERVRNEVPSDIITDVTSTVNELYKLNPDEDDDGNVLPGDDMSEDHNEAIESVYREWRDGITDRVQDRRWQTGDLRLTEPDPYASVETYREEHKKTSDKE